MGVGITLRVQYLYVKIFLFKFIGRIVPRRRADTIPQDHGGGQVLSEGLRIGIDQQQTAESTLQQTRSQDYVLLPASPQEPKNIPASF